MEYGLVPQEQWLVFRDVNNVKSRLDKRCKSLVAQLSAMAASETMLGVAAIEIAPAEGADITSIKTPVGNAQLVVSWVADAGELKALMSLERERRDQHGHQFWEHVWDIKVPQYDTPTLVGGNKIMSIPIDTSFGQQRSQAIFSVLVSVLYGITNGPDGIK